MPDWFYRTLTRPVLFRLPAERARNFALGFMGALSRLPFGAGTALIDFLGHMRADPRLARSVMGVEFPTPVGIGCRIDGRAVALPALARFGVGFLEVGPVSVAGSAGAAPLALRADQQAVWRPEQAATLSLDEALDRLREVREGSPDVALVVRVAAASAADLDLLAGKLGEVADLLVLSAEAGVARARAATARPVLLAVAADQADAEALVAAAVEEGAAGVLVEGSVRAEPTGRLDGLPAYARSLALVRALRRRWPVLPIVATGAAHEPEHALELLQAGADLVGADTGLIYSGPGLPKRINEAALFARQPPAAERQDGLRPAERSWFWTTLMGAGMLIGSVLALIIAATRVVLPYDEAFVGMSRAELDAVNPRLLAFLAHDRVSLAGTMVAIGVLYLGLSLFGVRRGLHWAQQAVFWSAFVGFGTFFLFLGYGYFDPFHAFVTGVLFQFLLMGLHARLGPPPLPESPQLRGDWRWRMALWGQLILIGHAAAVVVAGLVISGVGVTVVFVHEDLEFMRTTAEALRSANPRLVPMIAHDRASFGGMLVSVGLLLLLPALWGFRPCSAWLWWTTLLAVVPAYAAAVAVHHVVGYDDLFHLTPAYGGLAVALLGLALARPFLCRPGASEAEWARYRAA